MDSSQPRLGTDAAATQRFGQGYSACQNEATVALERDVIGGDYGANSFTTAEQADVLLRALDLKSGDRLLDVGAGRGWPGLYLANNSGCELVLTDLPLSAMQEAQRRATRDGLQQKSECIVASGSAMPFRPRSFDAVVHSDVLC